jgi:hypothetical protein
MAENGLALPRMAYIVSLGTGLKVYVVGGWTYKPNLVFHFWLSLMLAWPELNND